MKKRILLITAIIILLILVLILVKSCSLFTNEEKGTLVGEVFAVYEERYLYLKPIGNQEAEYLIPIEITPETLFASQSSTHSSKDVPELAVGTIIEVDYTHKPDIVKIIANSIKKASESQGDKWPELILKEDYSWSRSEVGMETSGKVVYVTKLTSQIEGYIVYIEDRYTGKLQGYLLEKNNKFLKEDLLQLLEEQAIDYTVKIKQQNVCPFSYDLPLVILGSFWIELAEE